MAAYTRRLRCAGAPRRPASGSGLSLTIPAWHAVLYDPEEFEHRHGPVLRCRHGLRRDLSGSALPKFPQSASRGARLSRLPGLLTLRPVRLLALLRRIEPASRPQRAFTSRLSAVWSPALPLDMTTTWTGLLVLAGLSPAGMAASLAAPDPTPSFVRQLHGHSRSRLGSLSIGFTHSVGSPRRGRMFGSASWYSPWGLLLQSGRLSRSAGPERAWRRPNRQWR